MSLSVISNAVLFQIVWFASVLGGARGLWWWGALALCALLAFCCWHGSLRRDGRLMIVLGAVGLLLDSLWASTGVLDYGREALSLGALSIAPAWIVILWMGVALTVLHSLKLLASRPLLGAIVAGGAAVPCYLGGARLGAVQIPDPAALGWVVGAWFVVFVVLFRWAQPRIEAADQAPSVVGEP